jgi:hypothetical protein
VILIINFSIEEIMENIIEPNELFDFTKLTLAHPSGIQGGAYFTKIENNLNPLYIQTNKSLTRQGFIKTGKKYHVDLMFDKNSEVIINWFENLEEKCRKLIYDKRDEWFQNKLEESDIESAFNSIIRVYKSGKFYLVRANVKNNHLQQPSIKIYNEKEQTLTMEDIKSETPIISILEIQGIKFTSRNFQFEIEIKQVMVLNEEPIFDNCLIKKNNRQQTQNEPIVENVIVNKPLEEFYKTFDEIGETLTKDPFKEQTKLNEPEQTEIKQNVERLENNAISELDELVLDELINSENDKSDAFDLDFVDLDKIEEEEDDPNELKECDLNLGQGNSLETITLKKPNQVYFDLYKEARKKAKSAKKNAILAYLEAKNIKKTYMLENMDQSDSDFDAEIDEVSESELEGL